jgi:hypothetical protein
VTPFEVQIIPAVPIFIISYLVEAYILLQHALPSPFHKLLPALPADIALLQPTLFSISCVHVIADDGHARKSIEDGGLGYRGICTTLEGMCMQIREWNLQHEGSLSEQQGLDRKVSGEMEAGNIGGVGATTMA